MKRFASFFLLLFLLCTFATAENSQTVRVLGETTPYDVYRDYTAQGNTLDFRFGTISDIATAIASRNPDIDVFILQTRSGLNQLKKQHYYYSLTDDTFLMDKVDDLYPVFRDALIDDGNLIGWYVDAQPWCWFTLWPDLLEEAECTSPTTFEELLDVCQALTESGLLGKDYAIMFYYPYTKSGMLTFYMEQYLMTSERVDGQINFLRPEFARIAAKIKATVPDTSLQSPNAFFEIFTTYMGIPQPNTAIGLIPTVLDETPSSLYYITVVAVINPYSNNIAGAIDFIHHLASYESTIAYLWDASLNQPVIRSDYDELVTQFQDEITRLEAKEKLTAQDESDLDYARSSLAYLIEHPYDISPEDIAYYQSIVQYAYISGDSPVTFDDALKTLMQRYLNGAFDAEGFARACQEHVNTVYLEMGLTPMYVPD